ncbi:NADH dehydrogenase [ubiquinone] 1 subunit C1, mitochondrial [Antennarius striatus]|uniref:NADH dehydrogenase [ubiquinone] 1 subunit C1, mitochondrial n=1 Tax=Antennarius striatus TaxID=241820 RepID=UPI0035B2BA7D
MTFSRSLSRYVSFNKAGSRSFFTSSKSDIGNPKWLRVGLSFGTTVFLWALLFKQHSADVHEYRVKNGLEPSST